MKKKLAMTSYPRNFSKTHRGIWRKQLVRLFNKIISDDMPNAWKHGILTHIRKNAPGEILKNHMPITLLDTVYKIRWNIIANKLAPFASLLENDAQNEYKVNKSTTDIIFYIERYLIKMPINGQTKPDLSKACGGIDRTKLREILYGAVSPI